MHQIHIQRVYDGFHPDDTAAGFLIDRLWPRGISKQDVPFDHWFRDLAPSNALRKWYQHDHDKWKEFQLRYFTELDDRKEKISELLETLNTQNIVLYFSSKERKYNNATALKAYLEIISDTRIN